MDISKNLFSTRTSIEFAALGCVQSPILSRFGLLARLVWHIPALFHYKTELAEVPGMKINRVCRTVTKGFLLCVMVFASGSNGQDDSDSLLFTIKLNDDSTSLLYCLWTDRVNQNLAGPVLMQKKSLLFYSQNGYVLYNQNGTIEDSASVYKRNKSEPAPLRLAYPIDSSTILYYEQKPGSAPEVFEKKLFRKSFKKVDEKSRPLYSEINKSFLVNIANNSVLDEMSHKLFLMPHLAGFTSVSGGMKWWSTDRMHSFSSPIIIEQDSKYHSFFPGLKADQHSTVKQHLIEPIGVFLSENRWFYYGLHSSIGSKDEEYFQSLVLCDQAGNILTSDRLLKQEVKDAVLTYVEESKTNYTVRRAGRRVFVPAIDRNGFLYYSILNYEWKKIDVYRRAHRHYVPVQVNGRPEDKFVKEGNLEVTPVKLECGSRGEKGIRPEVIMTREDTVDFLDHDRTTKKGYFVSIHRYTDDGLKTRLSRIQPSLPDYVQKMQDSIATTSTSWCPYTITLDLENKGEIARFYYGFGDIIMCARVMEVTNYKEVYIRVDFDTWAEIVVFTTEGKYMSRFIFNRKPFEDRKDLIVISDGREIFEQDYESDRSGKTYLRWELR